MLAAPLNFQILQALSGGPKQQVELRRECGMPAQTTLRAQLRGLEAAGTLDKRRRHGFPGGIDYELTAAGRELLGVSRSLERWLGASPHGELQLGGAAPKAAIKALAAGWSTRMLHALAAGPLTLTELNALIPSLSYPSLERRLAALRLAGLVSAREGNGRGRPYGLNRWGREAVAPVLNTLRWERRHATESTPAIARVDVETAFLMAVPLVELPPELSGSCRMAVELPGSDRNGGLCGATAGLEEGRVSSCTTKLEGCADAWASGSAGAWLTAVIDAELESLEIGGDCSLARDLVEELHRSLFGVRTG